MTCIIMIGRRVPKSWFRRQANRVGGLISFQENLWMIIKQSLNMAKKKANASGKLKFIITHINESEDMNYDIQWLKVMIQGNHDQEKEEYEEAMQMYGPLGKILKKQMPTDDRMKKHFKTKILNGTKVEEAYEKGYGSLTDNNIANKLLEMGILTHIEWLKDFNSREEDFTPDFG